MNRLCVLALIALALPHAAHAQADSALARTVYFTPLSALDARPGVFVYRFDAPGWPESVSFDGLPPAYATLRLDDLPFNDLVTGQARFDLLPVAWLDTLARGVQTNLRDWDAPRPRTELRYLSGPDGFQSVEAVHAQSRRRRLFGADGQVNAAFGYAGRAADNEYPNSDLRRGRATLARLGFETERSGIEVFNLHTRGTVGAPDGVVPPVPSDPGSIYDRFNATVRDRTARRQTIRNDTGLRLRRGAARAALYRTFERLRYDGDSLTVARMARYGFAATLSSYRRALDVDGWWQHAGEPSAMTGDRARLYAGVRDTLGAIVLRAGLVYDGDFRPEGALQMRLPFGVVRAEAHPITVPPVARSGFGVYAAGADPSTPLAVTGSVEVGGRRGDWKLLLRPFVSATLDGFDFVETGRDTLMVAPRDVQRAGMTAALMWRDSAGRGLYAQAQATVTADLESGITTDLPFATTDGRLGLRASLFRGDLRLDLFGRLRSWAAFDGRVLHDPTGLLVLPDTPMRVPASSTLDVTALLHVRTATLFLVYENALSGTVVLRGNYLVPGQPLPERRLRFGVFWPIFD